MGDDGIHCGEVCAAVEVEGGEFFVEEGGEGFFCEVGTVCQDECCWLLGLACVVDVEKVVNLLFFFGVFSPLVKVYFDDSFSNPPNSLFVEYGVGLEFVAGLVD